MGWFSRKLTDPEEAFGRLVSADKRIFAQAASDFTSNLNTKFIEFLCEKFEEQQTLEVRVRILEIFASKRDSLNTDDLRIILRLINYPDALLRETFKDILRGVTEDKLKPLTEVLCTTSDVGIRQTIQYAIEKSGLLDSLLAKWKDYSTKEKILYLEEIILIQNPKTYPIFFDILKEEVVESRKEEKKITQIEFCKHIDKIKDPGFMEMAIRELPGLDTTLWYPIFKCLQFHGEKFFALVFDGLGRKSESFRLKVMQILEQLSDPLSYPHLFPYLLDKFKSIPPIARDTIQGIVKHLADELDEMKNEKIDSPEIQKKIQFYTKPLEGCLSDRFIMVTKTICECLLRLGRHHNEIILRNFPKLFKYNENYLNSFLKGLEAGQRKDLLIKACCYKDIETGRTAVLLLSNPTENFIIETLNSLLLEHFMSVPQSIQGDVINLMMNPKLKRFVEEVLYHNDPALRSRILQILGESGSPNALQILTSKMRDPDYSVRKTILDLLMLPHFNTEEGTIALIEFLKDTDRNVVLETIEKLKGRDHGKILPSFTKLLGSKDVTIKESAHQAIAFVTRRKFMKGFDKMPFDTRYAIGTSLIKMDPNFLEDITRDLSDSDQRTRVLSARILEVLCDHIPPELKTNLIVAIQDPDPHVRSVVIMGLGKIGGPSVANMLVGFLKDQDDRVRANAVEAMSKVGDLSLVDQILPCLHDSNNRVRANAIMSLWTLGYYQIYDAVVEMFRNPDLWMRASAAFALGELKDQRFLPILLQCLRDPEGAVRKNVVRSLGKIANPMALAPYIRPLRFDPDESVRDAVAEILSAASGKKTK